MIDSATRLMHQWGEWYLSHTDAHWIAFTFTTLLVIEVLVGRAAKASFRDVAFNYIFVATLLTVLVVVRGWGISFADSVAKPLGGPWIDLTFETGHSVWRNIVADLCLLFVYDIFYYWHHRWQHTNRFAWVTHKLHHSDENLGVTTAYKHHWSDDALRIFTIVLPMALIFKLEPVSLFWVAYFVGLQGLLIHMNIDVSFGWFDRILVSPNGHRVHHSKLVQHHDKNFAAVFSLFDVAFGTFHRSEKIAPPTGLDTGEKYTNLWRAHFYPFLEWGAMAKARLANRREPEDRSPA